MSRSFFARFTTINSFPQIFAARFIQQSVPSSASTATTALLLKTTVCPISTSTIAFAKATACSISLRNSSGYAT